MSSPISQKNMSFAKVRRTKLATNFGSTGFDGKLVIPNAVRNPSGVNRKCFATGMLRFAQHDSV